jgi:hypothetical protein
VKNGTLFPNARSREYANGKIRMWKRFGNVACYLKSTDFDVDPVPDRHDAKPKAMPFFQCSMCGCVEDTALCRYWSARLRKTPTLCSACDPKIAKWHGQFRQESAEDWINDHGVLVCSKNDAKNDVERWLGQPIEIIGR